MAERRIFTTRDLGITSVTDQNRFPGLSDGEQFYSERVWFSENNWADVRMLLKDDTLKWVDNAAMCLDQGIGFYYDHNYWAPPFGMEFQPRELKNSYPAVINIGAVSETKEGKVSHDIRFGNFWYDEDGRLKAINCGYLTNSGFEANVPFLNLYRLDSESWLIYRMEDSFRHFQDKYLRGIEKVPESELLVNGREVVVDEIITCLTDDDETVSLHQRTLTGHKQKIITVPSVIDVARWSENLSRLNGEWTTVFQEFPIQIELEGI